MLLLYGSKRARSRVKSFISLAIVVSFLILGGCGSRDAGSDSKAGSGAATEFYMDAKAAGARLYQELEYRDSLEELDPVIVYILLGIDEADVAEQANYFSSGATAEEIIVFKAAGKEALETLKAAVLARVEDQKNVYASYAPEEVNYLKGAVIETKGLYLIYFVPADARAGAKLVKEILAE